MIQTQAIVDYLHELVDGRPVWLAYSGGVDSHVLLHILASASPPFTHVHVVHVNHQLQTQSVQWSEHCKNITEQFSLPFHLLNVDVTHADELGLEAAARQARYSAIKKQLPDNAVLITAQHQHDQAETLLLQLLRGAGPKGLAAMAKHGYSHGMEIIRPLLDSSQADINDYAALHQLSWIEDPSNQNTDLNRNYIRHQLWPLIEQRWPSAAKTLSRSSRLCAETDLLIAELAQQDLLNVSTNSTIQIDRLLALSLPRQRNCLRYFIQQQHLVLPSETVLQQIIDTVCLSAEDASPKVVWQDCEAIRYQQSLYIQLQPKMLCYQESYKTHGTEKIVLNEAEEIEWLSADKGISQELLEKGLTVSFRNGGETIQLVGKDHHQSLKNLFQEWRVPPWQRARIPLLFDDNDLIAVVGYAISEQALPVANQQGFEPVLKQRKT